MGVYRIIANCVFAALAGLISFASPADAVSSEDGTVEKPRVAPLEDGIVAARGVAAYRKNCLACHGKTGAGDGALAPSLAIKPPDFTTATAVTAFTPSTIAAALNRPHQVDTSSVWTDSLAPSDISAIVRFIREAFMLPAAVADASLGKKVFARTCSVCHGDRGNAASWAQNSLNPPPFDFTSYKAKLLTRRHMINTVTYGVEGTAMVGWATQLSRSEIAAVVDYIRETFIFPEVALQSSNLGNAAPDIPDSENDHAAHGHQHGNGGDAWDMTRQLPGNLVGDKQRGKELFDQNCAACHGKAGEGDGPRAYFIFPRPQNFKDQRAKKELNRPHLFASISDGQNGTVMPAWKTVMDDQMIADISEYVFSAFIMASVDASNGHADSEHETHEHETHEHETHEHETHEHEAREHETHEHEAHEHETHEHEARDHETHKHDAQEHEPEENKHGEGVKKN